MNEFKQAYETLLKENTKLHAEKKHIVDSAEKAIRSADDQIQTLHSIINKIVSDAIEIVQAELPDSNEKTTVIVRLQRLTPLQISADGQEKKP